MFWRKKKLQSKEYLELKQQVDLLWLELDTLTRRYKRKITTKEIDKKAFDLLNEERKIDDGFDELRKLNKEDKP